MERAFLATEVVTRLKNSDCLAERVLVSDVQDARRYNFPPHLLTHTALMTWGHQTCTPEWVEEGFSRTGTIDESIWVEGFFGEKFMGLLVKPEDARWQAHFVTYVPHTTIPTMSLGTFEFSKTTGVAYREPNELRELMPSSQFVGCLARVTMGTVLMLKTDVSPFRVVSLAPQHPLSPPSLGAISVEWNRGKPLLLSYEPD